MAQSHFDPSRYRWREVTMELLVEDFKANS